MKILLLVFILVSYSYAIYTVPVWDKDGNEHSIVIQDIDKLTQDDLKELLYDNNGNSLYKEESILHLRLRQLERQQKIEEPNVVIEEKPIIVALPKEEIKQKEVIVSEEKTVETEIQNEPKFDSMWREDGTLRDPVTTDNYTAKQSYTIVIWFFVALFLWMFGMNIHPIFGFILLIILIILSVITFMF